MGPGWVVSEDNPGSHSDYDRLRRDAGYVNAAMCYNETYVGPNVGATQVIGGTILTSEEITQQSATHGGSVIVLTRSFENDGWSAAVDAALKNPDVSGVALECYPNRSPLYLDSLRVKELISACLSNNKNFYFLSPGYDNYVAYMKGYINLLISEGVDFSDNRIFLVQASYDFIAPFIGGAESVQGVIKYYLSIEERFKAPTEINRMQQPVLEGYHLSQNYPNPFNPSTTIKYSIPQICIVSIKVYNLIGQVVAILVNKYQDVGNYSVYFKALNLASGIYLYRIESKSYSLVKKMILIK